MAIETQEQALAEARKRFGERAEVWERPSGTYWVSDGYPEWKAELLGLEETICGSGETWDAAFADAEKREGR